MAGERDFYYFHDMVPIRSRLRLSHLSPEAWSRGYCPLSIILPLSLTSTALLATKLYTHNDGLCNYKMPAAKHVESAQETAHTEAHGTMTASNRTVPSPMVVALYTCYVHLSSRYMGNLVSKQSIPRTHHCYLLTTTSFH